MGTFIKLPSTGGGSGPQILSNWEFSALELDAVMQCETQFYSGFTIGA